MVIKNFQNAIIFICILNCFLCENESCLNYNDMSEDMKYQTSKLKFINGPCHPVVFIPGLFGSTLYLNIRNCKAFKEKNIDFKHHCRKTDICNNVNVNTYTGSIWPRILGDFGFLEGDRNYKNICFSYFMQFYNSKHHCLNADSSVNCRYSDHVRIYPFDISAKDKIDPMKSIIDLRNASILETQSTHGFRKMYEGLKAIGYENNFSLSAIPYDFREAVCENKAFGETLLEVSKNLYKNTKKKVVIIAHSYGCLNTLYQLNKRKALKEFVKHFISIAPPYLGSVNA